MRSLFLQIRNSLILSTFLIGVSFCFSGVSIAQESAFAKFKNHLEFLSYTCEIKSEKKMRCTTKKSDPNFSLKIQSGGFLMVTYYGGTEQGKKERASFLNFANKCNSISIATRFYLDKDTDLAMESWFSGGYNKQAFANTIEQFNNDWSRIRKKLGEDLTYFVK